MSADKTEQCHEAPQEQLRLTFHVNGHETYGIEIYVSKQKIVDLSVDQLLERFLRPAAARLLYRMQGGQ